MSFRVEPGIRRLSRRYACAGPPHSDIICLYPTEAYDCYELPCGYSLACLARYFPWCCHSLWQTGLGSAGTSTNCMKYQHKQVFGVCIPRAEALCACALRPNCVTSVDCGVNCGQTPTKRTLQSVRNASMLEGSVVGCGFCGQLPGPSGGEGFHAFGGGVWGGGRHTVRQGRSGLLGAFHTERHKPSKGET